MLNTSTISGIEAIVMDFQPSSKKKKTRRGKRCGRKARVALFQKENHGKYFDSTSSSCVCDHLIIETGNVSETCADCSCERVAGISANTLCTPRNFRSPRSYLIRPRYSPKAPHNSTQFIMNEHQDIDNYLCRNGEDYFYNFPEDREFYEEVSPEKDNFLNNLKQNRSNYFSNNGIEVTNRHRPISDNLDSPNTNNNGSDVELSNEFESSCDFNDIDSVAFMINDFEQTYDSIRSEQLSNLSKPELIEAVTNLEKEVNIRENKLIRTNTKSLGFTPNKVLSDSPNNKCDMQVLLKEWNKLKSENVMMKREIEALQKAADENQ